jgi:hypothetical protein
MCLVLVPCISFLDKAFVGLLQQTAKLFLKHGEQVAVPLKCAVADLDFQVTQALIQENVLQ